MSAIEKRAKTRYLELCAKVDRGEFSEREQWEWVQLFYELHPDRQFWRGADPELTPDDIWGDRWRRNNEH